MVAVVCQDPVRQKCVCARFEVIDRLNALLIDGSYFDSSQAGPEVIGRLELQS